MSALEHNSVDEDSQASHILLAMLNPRGPTRKTNDMRIIEESNSNITNEFTDSSSSHNLSSLTATFDLHGLAQTQTQRLEEEDDTNVGSQKENIGAAKGEPLTSNQSAPFTTPASEGTKVRDTNFSKSTALNSPSKPKLKTLKGVSFQSPRKSLPPQTVNDNSPAQRLPTRAKTLPNTTEAPLKHIASPLSSQDSFGILDQDPGQQFLANSKHFNAPLSELADIVSATASLNGRRRRDSMHSSNYPPRTYRRSSSPPEETILVQPTPSASGGSQSQQSQLFSDAQPLYSDIPRQSRSSEPDADEDVPMVDMEDLSQHPIEDCLSDAPSNFYTEQNEDSLPSTALEATQPSTQVEEEKAIDELPSTSESITRDVQSTVTTNPRSLLSMVDPNKRHRYQHLVQHRDPPSMTTTTSSGKKSRDPLTPKVQQPSIPPSVVPQPVQAVSNHPVETQPSLEDQALQRPRRRFPGRPQSNSRIPQEADARDIIPDSEPQREEGMRPRRPLHVIEAKASHEQDFPGEVAKALFPADEDEDIPLSAVVAIKDERNHPQSDSKGKGRAFHDLANDNLTNGSNLPQGRRAVSTEPNQQSTVQAPSSNAHMTRGAAALPVDRLSGIARSWQTGVVPSSLPEEEAGRAEGRSRTKAPRSIKENRKTAAAQACTKPKQNTAVRRSRRRAESNSKDSPLSASDDELRIKAVQDNTTESDDTHDGDFVGPSQKRKRNAPPQKAAKAPLKSSKRLKGIPSTTPSTGQVKHLRSVASTSRTCETATRVFALWKQDGCYYPGTILVDYGNGLYEVHFDDNSDARVSIDQMRRLDLRIDDDVMICNSNYVRGFKVTAVDQLESSQVVNVRVDTGVEEFNLVDLKIANRTIKAAWKDRVLSRHMISSQTKFEGKASPPQSEQSMAIINAPRRAGRSHLFEKTAFVVSVSSTEGNWNRERENLTSGIKNNGGVIVNDWSDVIDFEGTYFQHNNRWVIEKNDAVWVGTGAIERIFLVADLPSYKPKFLIALALGVPCLKAQWLHDTISTREEKDWLAYMLSQGHCDALKTQISQQVDVSWGSSTRHLSNIMNNEVPCKLFNGKSILCVGDMIPKAKSKKLTLVEEKSHEAHNALTRIILSMGADRVEAVSEVVYASAPIREYDFVVIKSPELYSPKSGMLADKTVEWTWVKECLIASRFLPPTEWAAESQDA